MLAFNICDIKLKKEGRSVKKSIIVLQLISLIICAWILTQILKAESQTFLVPVLVKP